MSWLAISHLQPGQPFTDSAMIKTEATAEPSIPHPISSSTNVQIANNYVRDVNLSSNGAGDNGTNGQAGCCAEGVYLDDGTSNVTITGNILAGVMSGCIQMNDGENNVMTGNICDLANSAYQSIVIYGWGYRHLQTMPGNVFSNNIVISGSTGSSAGFYGATRTPTPMTISNNAYYNYVGSSIKSSGGAGTDTNPVYENPQLSGWKYKIATGSPVLNPPSCFRKFWEDGGHRASACPRPELRPHVLIEISFRLAEIVPGEVELKRSSWTGGPPAFFRP
jgi:hypothetical protein